MYYNKVPKEYYTSNDSSNQARGTQHEWFQSQNYNQGNQKTYDMYYNKVPKEYYSPTPAPSN